MHQGDGTVERRGGVSEEFEYVTVVESVRIRVSCSFARCGREREPCCMLWDTVNVGMPREVDVERERFGTFAEGCIG